MRVVIVLRREIRRAVLDAADVFAHPLMPVRRTLFRQRDLQPRPVRHMDGQLDRVVLDGDSEAHAREDAGTPALRKHSAIATPPVISASPDTTISPSLVPR